LQTPHAERRGCFISLAGAGLQKRHAVWHALCLLATNMVDPIFSSDSYRLVEKLLDASALRQQAIASNIANSETPGYHRLDIAPDFATQLKASFENGGMSGAAATLQPKLAEDSQARSVRPDGNSVDLQQELIAMNRNSVEYSYLTEIVSNNFKSLRIAITGQPS
jgi:flagellar basal-body rod protein FlgB